MSYDIALDKSHDLHLKDADLLIIGAAKRVAQQVKVTLLTFEEEWFLDTAFGVPYLDKILVKRPRRQEIETILRERIKDVPGVSGVAEMKLLIDHPLRRFAAELKINTPEGNETVELTL